MAKTVKSEKTTYHHGDLRAALVEATRQLIEEKGIDHFSVSDACRRAGVSTAAPYKHFKNKGEMINAVMLESMDRHKHEMLAAVQPYPEGSLDRIRALGRNYVGFAQREPGIFLLRFGQNPDPHLPEVEDLGQDTYDIVQHEVAKILGEPGVTDKVKQRSFMLWSFVHGLSMLTMNPELAEKGGNLDVEELLNEIGWRVLRD
ncbi:TetR/AcrR family transcriptional regulator [uncultured Tateyamaria sp.]|uniref:TetR/AcrR family transcriptional regulator n=1 Tax=Tateyamaria sp. 1078 TaxID=3417464 RepID=UPI002606444D|nr:TetR/AcrR family transcriptional regulator [uncultured Tateyamaria sp.]